MLSAYIVVSLQCLSHSRDGIIGFHISGLSGSLTPVPTCRFRYIYLMSSRTACGTCHLRMVFCDSTRPYCQTCIDGGFVCSGYSASVSSQHSSQDTPERGPVRPSHTLSARGRRQSTTVFSRASSRPTSPQQIRRPRSLSLPTHTNGAANQNRILSVFLDLASPGGNINNVPAQYAWLQILPTRRLRGEALPLAISALCGVHLGTIRRDQRLLQGARVHYTEALQKLATTLTQIDGGDYDETFASIMILTLCEVSSYDIPRYHPLPC